MSKMSDTQLEMLRRLCRAPEHVPGGRPNSGREASAWARTARALQDRGLCVLETNGPGTGRAIVTALGRLALEEIEALR